MVCALSAPVAARPDDSDDIAYRKMRFAERSGNLAVTTAFTEIFDSKSYKKLSSGLVSNVVVRIYVYAEDDAELPVSFVLANFQVVYDLWDEVYTVKKSGPLGNKKKRYKRKADALKAVTELDEFPIAPLGRISVGPHYFMAMVVELNPVSEELLAEMRRWLSRASTDANLDTGSSFFGSFVSVFVNPKLPEADAVLRVQSQPFYRTRR
jgi:hypothetical protein